MGPNATSNLRFKIKSLNFSGNFILAFEPIIISDIEAEIDIFISDRKKKVKKDNLSILKTKDGYEITPKSFIAVCNIIFRVIKRYS